MSTTSDRSDPRLTHGTDAGPVPQAEVYLVLSEAERARGFTRPLRRSYRHVGPPGPEHELRDLTDEERERYADAGYVKFEEYWSGEAHGGMFWTQERLDGIGKGCGAVTTMAPDIAESYARQPGMYGSTYCCTCMRHLFVGERGEFTWIEQDGSDGPRVGT